MERALQQLAGLVQCVRCRGRQFGGASGGGLNCLICGHELTMIDGVLQASRDDEDMAIDRERRAVLDLEMDTGLDGNGVALSDLLQGGPARDAFLSLPHGDGSMFFGRPGYFTEVARFASTFDAVVSRLPLPAGSIVLDVGADLTWSTAQLTRRGWRAVAIDINHHLAASRVFRDQGHDFAAVNVDMHAPLFASAVFDAVTAFNALHHTHRLDALIENLTRTLKPGGYLAFIEPYWEHEHNRTTFGASQIEAGINENVYRLEEWHQTFVRHGLEPVFFAPGASFHGIYQKGMARGRPLSVADARVDLFERFYQAELSASASVASTPGGAVVVPVRVRNASQAGWSSHSQMPVFASYHLRRAVGGERADAGWELVSFDNPRTPLPGTVFPGDDIVVPVQVTVPSEPGAYAIDIDLVHEGVTWFADRNAAPLTVTLHVAPGPA